MGGEQNAEEDDGVISHVKHQALDGEADERERCNNDDRYWHLTLEVSKESESHTL